MSFVPSIFGGSQVVSNLGRPQEKRFCFNEELFLECF